MPAGGGMTSARTLREPLEHLYREFDYTARVEFDAIRFPLRYPDPRDRELVGLLAACLAYGRVDLFGRQLDGVLAVMGPSPAAFVVGFDPRRAARASACTCSCAGWSAASRPTSACGRRSRRRVS